MPDKIRIGVIGAGLVTDLHWNGYKNLTDRFDIVAVADSIEEKAKMQAAKFGARKVYKDHRDLLADEEIQAVDICLPHNLHCNVATHAARFKKHILCEKPMATTLEEADWMMDAAREHGVKLMIAENFRFFPSVRKTKELIAEGAIGEPVFMQAFYATMLGGKWVTTPWRFEHKEVGGGPLIDGGIHIVDVMLNVMGDVSSVHCHWKSIRPQFPAEDISVISMEFTNGALGQLTNSASLPATDSLGWTVFGTKGFIQFSSSSRVHLTAGEFDGEPPTWICDAPERIECDASDSFQLELAHFADFIQNGVTCEMPGEEGKRDLQFVLSAYESARTGQRISMA